MRFKIFKLNFTTPVHCGEKGIGLEKIANIIHSDTLFGAIVNAWILLYDKIKVQNFLEEHASNPKFRISSGFLYKGEVLFFPRPFTDFNISEDVYLENSKRIKGINYLPLKYFQKFVQGEEFTKKDIDEIEIALNSLNKTFQQQIIPKNTLDRLTLSSNIYYIGLNFFDKDTGIYLLIDANGEIYDDWLLPAFKILQDEGIGGKKTWGCGLYKLVVDEIELNTPEAPSHFMTMSLFYPNVGNGEGKLFHDGFWKLTQRGGWIFSKSHHQQARKPHIKLFLEGSIFKNKPIGKLIKLNINNIGHPIYHNGYSFPIPIKIGGIEAK